MNRSEVQKARHDARRYNRDHAHVAYMQHSINDYGDFAPRPRFYGFASSLTRCVDPMLRAKRDREEKAKRIREDRHYRAERAAKNAAARAAQSPATRALFDRVDAALNATAVGGSWVRA